MELVTDDIADFVEIVVGCKIVVAVVVDIVDSQTVVVAAVSIAVVVAVKVAVGTLVVDVVVAIVAVAVAVAIVAVADIPAAAVVVNFVPAVDTGMIAVVAVVVVIVVVGHLEVQGLFLIYLENRQGHLLINLCKGVASMEFANDRLCFIEFVQFICRVHLERLHIKEGGGQTVQKQPSIHDHIMSNHGENIQLMKHHNKQVDLLKEIPSFIVYGSHIVDGAYHNIIKPKNFALTLKETIEKFASV